MVLFTGAADVSVAAKFNMNGVSGIITFMQSLTINNHTMITVSLSGLDQYPSETFPWHVHNYPFTTQERDPCSAGSVGGHFDPFMASSRPNSSTSCSSNRSLCEVGDLSGKFGPFNASSLVNKTYMDTYLPLYGVHSIVGRSVVIHRNDGSRWVCANIEYPNDVTVAYSPFRKNVINGGDIIDKFHLVGNIFFIEPYSPMSLTTVFVQLSYISASVNSTSHDWHIHNNTIGSDGKCSNAGPYYNPRNISTEDIGYLFCKPSNQTACEVGDLTRKSSKLSFTNGHSVFFYTDINLPVRINGLGETIIGRSVVIHSENTNHAEIACANLLEYSPRIARAKFQEDGVTGQIIFKQSSPFSPTIVRVQLNGLSSRAGDYHIHEFPVDEAIQGSSKCTGAGGHYNPRNIIRNSSSPTTFDAYEIGDLSGKFQGGLFGLNSINSNYSDPYLSLFGTESIVGRSVVIHHPNGDHWLCTNILYDADSVTITADMVITATDTTNGTLQGRLVLTQLANDPYSETTIFVYFSIAIPVIPSSYISSITMTPTQTGNVSSSSFTAPTTSKLTVTSIRTANVSSSFATTQTTSKIIVTSARTSNQSSSFVIIPTTRIISVISSKSSDVSSSFDITPTRSGIIFTSLQISKVSSSFETSLTMSKIIVTSLNTNKISSSSNVTPSRSEIIVTSLNTNKISSSFDVTPTRSEIIVTSLNTNKISSSFDMTPTRSEIISSSFDITPTRSEIIVTSLNTNKISSSFDVTPTRSEIIVTSVNTNKISSSFNVTPTRSEIIVTSLNTNKISSSFNVTPTRSEIIVTSLNTNKINSSFDVTPTRSEIIITSLNTNKISSSFDVTPTRSEIIVTSLNTNKISSSFNVTPTRSEIIVTSLNTNKISSSFDVTPTRSEIIITSLNTIKISSSFDVTPTRSEIIVTSLNTNKINSSDITPVRSEIIVTTLNTNKISSSFDITPTRSEIIITSLNTNKISSSFDITPTRSEIIITSLNTNKISSSFDVTPTRSEIIITSLNTNKISSSFDVTATRSEIIITSLNTNKISSSFDVTPMRSEIIVTSLKISSFDITSTRSEIILKTSKISSSFDITPTVSLTEKLSVTISSIIQPINTNVFSITSNTTVINGAHVSTSTASFSSPTLSDKLNGQKKKNVLRRQAQESVIYLFVQNDCEPSATVDYPYTAFPFCSSTNQLACPVEDLVGKHGPLSLGRNLLTDLNLPLTGPNSGK